MSRELHSKASRTRILSNLPSKNLGSDGDFVLSNIKGKGTYLCAKSKGEWHVTSKLEELRKLEKTSTRELSLKKLKLGDATLTKEEYNINSTFTIDSENLVLDSSRAMVLKTGSHDIELNSSRDIELDSSRSIVLDSVLGSGQGILLKNSGVTYGMFDAHHSATYFTLYPNAGDTTDDYFTIFVQANGETELMTFHNAASAGHLTLDVDGDIKMDANSGITKFMLAGDTDDLCTLTVAANGATTIATADSDGSVGHLTLDIDGDIELNADGGDIAFKDDSADLAALSSSGLTINNISEVGSDTDKFLTSDSGVVKYVTGANLRSYIGAGTSSVANLNDLGDVSYSNGDLTISLFDTLNILNETGFTIDSAREIVLDANNGVTKFYLAGDTDDLCTLTVAANGATTIATEDSDGAAGHLTLDPDGDLRITGANVTIGATQKFYFDSGADTYIEETSADVLDIYVGGDNIIKLSEKGADGNTFDFQDCAVGFSRVEQTFSSTDVKGTGGTDDTDIDFRKSNKFRLEMTGDIAQMNLIFPPASGNFVLVTSTNGDHDVTAWKVWESDESAATTTDVMWAGGSVPAFTSSGVDICSFYWDATEQQCYGVCSLAFATP